MIGAFFSQPVSQSRWQLFEWCDLDITPSFVKHCCQSMLTAQWTHRLQVIQQSAPAELAADLIRRVLDRIEDINDEKYTVIDFCSGAGGPTPMIERSVNSTRKLRHQPPIPFRLSDIHPNIDAWMTHASHSAHLSFLPQPCDATSPPPSAISKTSPTCPFPDSAPKRIHLFSLSFHHFSDAAATRVIASSLQNSDVFAIIELQDRTIGMLLMMLFEPVLLLLLTIFWFPGSPLHLLFTYAIPLLPAVHAWDGVVSCLRTRTFEEMVEIVERVVGETSKLERRERKGGEMAVEVVCGEWRFSGVRKLHTMPFGYMNAFVGIKQQRT